MVISARTNIWQYAKNVLIFYIFDSLFSKKKLCIQFVSEDFLNVKLANLIKKKVYILYMNIYYIQLFIDFYVYN